MIESAGGSLFVSPAGNFQPTVREVAAALPKLLLQTSISLYHISQQVQAFQAAVQGAQGELTALQDVATWLDTATAPATAGVALEPQVSAEMAAASALEDTPVAEKPGEAAVEAWTEGPSSAAPEAPSPAWSGWSAEAPREPPEEPPPKAREALLALARVLAGETTKARSEPLLVADLEEMERAMEERMPEAVPLAGANCASGSMTASADESSGEEEPATTAGMALEPVAPAEVAAANAPDSLPEWAKAPTEAQVEAPVEAQLARPVEASGAPEATQREAVCVDKEDPEVGSLVTQSIQGAGLPATFNPLGPQDSQTDMMSEGLDGLTGPPGVEEPEPIPQAWVTQWNCRQCFDALWTGRATSCSSGKRWDCPECGQIENCASWVACWSCGGERGMGLVSWAQPAGQAAARRPAEPTEPEATTAAGAPAGEPEPEAPVGA